MGEKRKRIIIITGGMVLLAAIICTFLFFINRNDEYRTIQIYKIEGSAIVDRDGVGRLDAYNGMMMQSGDTVYTDKESCLYFKMDEDKFALLEPESTVRIEASGTDSDSRTFFYLESGALVSRLDSKLGPDSVYEVNTPNSTMAVRGTIFRIEVTYDESGVSYTNVYVFDGTVECQLVFRDGGVDEEVKQAQKGVMVRIRGDNTISEYILDNGTVDYGQLPVEVLRFLKVAVEEGIELPLSNEELEAILAEIEQGAHEHSGGTATCISPAVCSYDDCGQAYGEKDAANHTGGTAIRNKTDATCTKPGYTGDTYCLGCGAMLLAGSEVKIDSENHAGGTENRGATAGTCRTFGYSGDTYCLGCGEMIQAGSVTEKDAANHAGGTNIRNGVTADCCTGGYSGDTYCLGCGEMIQAGSVSEKNAANHVGGTEIRNSVTADCCTEGYSGDTYCLGCGGMIQAGSVSEKNAANHAGGTEIRNSVTADCCTAGYSGDIYCLGCGSMIEKGIMIAATGNHPTAACGISGHHLHDGKKHAVPSCGTTGHCISDGLNHDIASCQIISHHNCDGETHGKICHETDAANFDIEVIVTDNGSEWSFTFNGTVYEKYQDQPDDNQYYYYFRGNAKETVVITRTGMTGDFYASSEIANLFAEGEVLTFTLNEGEEAYRISIFIS